jgi:predicted transposase YdaD
VASCRRACGRQNLGGRGDSLEERGELCLAEEVERLRRLGLSDGEVASRLGVDVSWVETLISPGEDEAHPESEG